MGVFQYFSYGSNLLRERILISNPTAKFRCVGRLSHYSLTFDTPIGHEQNRWHGAAATIEQKSDSYVMGCVWEIDEAQTANLDKQEALYNPMFVAVELEDGEICMCRTYQMKPEVAGLKLPSPFYLKVRM